MRGAALEAESLPLLEKWFIPTLAVFTTCIQEHSADLPEDDRQHVWFFFQSYRVESNHIHCVCFHCLVRLGGSGVR